MLRRTISPDVRLIRGVSNRTAVARGVATSTSQGMSNEKPSKSKSEPKELEAKAAEDSLLSESSSEAIGAKKEKRMTMAELDEELRLKLEGISGEGGEAGVEYEGGKAEGLKRGVKANMFRVM